MTYSDLLKLLLPHGAYSDSDLSDHGRDLSVHAGGLDGCQGNADSLLSEIFPDTTDALLEDWERIYGLSQSDKPIFQRLQNLLAAINTRGGLSIPHLQAALKPFIGINAEIEEYMVFRCDDPRCLTDGDLYAFTDDNIFKFTAKIDNSQIQTAGYNYDSIMGVLNRIKPAHTQALIDTGLAGFFCDDPDSLTDQTLLAI